METRHMALKNTIKEFQTYLGDNESLIDKNHKNIAGKILLLWGYPEFYELMEQLLVVEKDRERSGFSLDVIMEFNELLEIHEHKFPRIKPKPLNLIN
jgi:hypothetical protein